MKPLAVDLCCGLGGWTDGLLAEGWDAVGFDIERHVYGDHRYPAQLVLQDILTLGGEQFRGKVSLIVCSPPCQKYSYMAMPWRRAKALQKWYRDADHPERIAELNAIFDACVRIGREARCPTIIENVRGAQKWVGDARANYGSFYLWGDVPVPQPGLFDDEPRQALVRRARAKVGGLDWKHPDDPRHRPGQAFNTTAEAHIKNPGFRFDGSGRSFQSESVERQTKNNGGSWFNVAHNTTSGKGQNPDGRKLQKPHGGSWFYEYGPGQGSRNFSSGSLSRKFASAMIAKIPLALSTHIARSFLPRRDRFGLDIEPSTGLGY